MATYQEGDNFIKFGAPGSATCRFEIATQTCFAHVSKINRARNLKLSTGS